MIINIWGIAILVALFAFFIYWRKDLYREMLWSGLLALPFLVIKPLISSNFIEVAQANGGIVYFLISRLLFSFLIGAIAGAFYEVYFAKILTPQKHPLRHKLAWLLTGPVLFTVLFFVFKQLFIVSILTAIIVDATIILYLRKDLIWDSLFSAVGVGFLYLILFLLTTRGLPGDLNHFWLSESVIGINLLGVPIEELVTVVLFGALWGPLYVAIKGLREKTDVVFELKHIKLKIRVLQSATTILAIVAIWLISQFIFVPKVSASSPSSNSINASLNSTIEIHFDKPVNRKELEISINPQIEGSWSFNQSFFQEHLFKTASFKPDLYFLPDTEYTLQIKNIKNALGRGGNEHRYTFHTQPIPKIISASITDQQSDVAICDPIQVAFDLSVESISEINFYTIPEQKLNITLAQDKKNYTITPIECFTQGMDYQLIANQSLLLDGLNEKLTDQNQNQEIWKIGFKTKNAPGVESITPNGVNVLTTVNAINIKFSQAMLESELEQNLKIEPAIKGSWRRLNEKELVYDIEEKLPFNTRYSITILAGVKDASGGYIDKNIVYHFTTIGHVELSGHSPKNSQTSIFVNSTISLTFNQEVDHDSAQSLFKIAPETSGAFSWKGNTMYFKPNALEKDGLYSVRLGSGIKSVHGLPSQKEYSFSFYTEESVTILNIKMHYQEKSLSCEIAATKMALSYKGVNVSEDELLNLVGFDPTIKQGDIWGDPYSAFVGDVNGKQNTTGYGVYWGPIARAASSYRRAVDFSGWTAVNLAEQINAGNPVVVWGVIGNSVYTPWYTPSGKFINAWKGEHARTLIGFTGKVTNPTKFIINDPIKGRLTWTRAQFESNWSVFGNSGVVVY